MKRTSADFFYYIIIFSWVKKIVTSRKNFWEFKVKTTNWFCPDTRKNRVIFLFHNWQILWRQDAKWLMEKLCVCWTWSKVYSRNDLKFWKKKCLKEFKIYFFCLWGTKIKIVRSHSRTGMYTHVFECTFFPF